MSLYHDPEILGMRLAAKVGLPFRAAIACPGRATALSLRGGRAGFRLQGADGKAAPDGALRELTASPASVLVTVWAGGKCVHGFNGWPLFLAWLATGREPGHRYVAEVPASLYRAAAKLAAARKARGQPSSVRAVTRAALEEYLGRHAV